ncbi:nuclear protein MDM1 [Scomber japonicus]|uniref:nuclear protein MDM1 n=1 Tax=Scomber japonicus TaxID=13676 RepID=UPI002305781B|nr:nuclear protein MDM1 [Scomber japonicus]
MTVRFKSQSEYQKSYRVSRSSSASPQRYAPWAGLRSDQMAENPAFSAGRGSVLLVLLSPEPFCSVHQIHSSLSLSRPFMHREQRLLLLKNTYNYNRSVLLAVMSCLLHPPPKTKLRSSRSRSAHRKEPSREPRPPTPTPGSRTEPASLADREPPAGPRRAADPEARTAGKSSKPRPSKRDSQPQPSSPVTSAPDGLQPSTYEEVELALRRRAGLRSGGQRSGSHRTEYNRQFSWKKPVAAASPLLTAEQVLYSSSRSVSPLKKKPVSMTTEYQQSFQGLLPPARPRLRKHLEHQRVPLFYTHKSNKKRREESENVLRPDQLTPTSSQRENATPPPPRVQRGHRMLTEYQSSFRSPLYRIPEEGGDTDADAPQLSELRQRALAYRRRAWGTNFSRDHLSQLLSEHTALWEPTDTTTDSPTQPPTPSLSCSRTSSCVEALDLAREEGRLPTPKLKTRPVQRTHHDVTTPVTGAVLVGKMRSSDAAADLPVSRKEAWLDINPTRLLSSSPAPNHKPASSPPSKPIRTKRTPYSLIAPPPPGPTPQHGIQGTLRHPDFQHNGDLGLRFRELQCSGQGCGSDEDDRLSVMSWRSAASCSVASSVLERAQKRRENFWGKR